jgi:hypothetical protein
VPVRRVRRQDHPTAGSDEGLRIEYLRRNFWLPLRREDHHIVVLIDNPQDLQRIDSVAQA